MQSTGNVFYRTLPPLLVKKLRSLGISKPTAAQTLLLPALTDLNVSAILTAETGGGKTLAYLLPIASRFFSSKLQGTNGPRGIVLVPTHDLAMQVGKVFNLLCSDVSVRAAVLGKGTPLSITTEVGVVVSTPGTLARFDLSGLFPKVDSLVIDEADFLIGTQGRNVWKVVSHYHRLSQLKPFTGLCRRPALGGLRQFVFIGATMPNIGPKSCVSLIKNHFPEIKSFTTEAAHKLHPGTTQLFIRPAVNETRYETLCKIIDGLQLVDSCIIIFVNTVAKANQMFARLRNTFSGPIAVLHKKISDGDREAALAAMNDLTSKSPGILVATDFAARGFDLLRLSHVIQYDFALDATSYLHRVGRVSRQGTPGTAISIILPEHDYLARHIELSVKTESTACLETLFSRKRSLRNKQRSK